MGADQLPHQKQIEIWQNFMKEVDLKGNQRIDYEEFSKVMKNIVKGNMINLISPQNLQDEAYELS